MGFPDDSLTADEHVVLHLHPHWKAVVFPAWWTLVAIAAVLVAWQMGPSGTGGSVLVVAVGAVALLLFLWLAFWPFLVWRSTHYVFTNERVMLRKGVISREQRDIQLNRVSDVSSRQSLLERLLGCGTLTVESAGEKGQSELVDIPKVVQVQRAVYELVEADHDRRSLDDSDLRRALREVQGESNNS